MDQIEICHTGKKERERTGSLRSTRGLMCLEDPASTNEGASSYGFCISISSVDVTLDITRKVLIEHEIEFRVALEPNLPLVGTCRCSNGQRGPRRKKTCRSHAGHSASFFDDIAVYQT
jgi:hypothetical protein